MLKANKSKWFEKLFYIYNRNLLRRRFSGFHVNGIENLTNKNKHLPTIVYANHSSWWDGLVAFHLSQKADLDFYVMMEEKQLRNLRLFLRLGAFSVNRENSRSAVNSLRYAAQLLNDDQQRTLWVFPQGEILPNEVRPLKFYNGVSRIIEKIKECQLFGVAMKYEFRGDFKPEIYLQISEGEIVRSGQKIESKLKTAELSQKMAENLNRLGELIVKENFKHFKDLL
jgi:hypothetical protein